MEVPFKKIASEIAFIKEGGEVDILFWNDKPLEIEIPSKVDLRVLEATPGVKGNSATNVFKEAVVQGGLKVKVPLFINKGDIVRLDTRSGEYLARAK